MAGIRFVSQVLNQREAPALYEDLRSKLPAPGFRGRIFFATDGTVGDTIYRDTGTLWEVLASNNPTVTGVTNGLSLFGNNVGLGGNLVQNTQIICDNFLIKFDTYSQFAIGNNLEPSMLFDTGNSKISTSYNGSIIGLSLDFANSVYLLGGDINNIGSGIKIDDFNQYIKFFVNGSFDGISFDFVNKIYNVGAIYDTLFLNFDVNNEIIKTTYQGNDKGITLDFANNVYKFGDFNAAINGTFITIDDTNQKIYTTNGGSQRGLELDFNNGFYKLGDYNLTVNGTNIEIDDGQQQINLISNLGLYNLSNLQIHPNNAAALAAGLVVGDLYYQGAGNLHIVF